MTVPDLDISPKNVLEETAFKLSADCAQDDDAMKAMNLITIMLGRYRSAAVREARAQRPSVRATSGLVPFQRAVPP